MVAQSCQGALQARAYSYFAGQPWSGQLAKFWGSEYRLSLQTSDPYRKEVQMAPKGDTVCYLTRVGGDFGGGAERVRIFPKLYNGIEYWYLEVTAGKNLYDRRPMYDGARCYKRDQR